MKKLMIAATMAMIGAAFAIDSNIVGYNNKELLNGKKMIGASFGIMGTNGKQLLSQLKPTGYLDNEELACEDAGGTYGDYTIQLLKPNGSEAAVYFWNHEWTEEDGWVGSGAWYDSKNQEITTENDVEFPLGQGLWFNAGYYEDGYALANSGEALLDSQDIPLLDGKKAIAIPLSAQVKLSQIKPVGYTDNEDCTNEEAGGTWGDYTIQLLKPNGSEDAVYFWNHEWTEDDGWVGTGAWYNSKNEEITSENDVTFAMGDGLWVNDGVYDDGDALHFPGIED